MNKININKVSLIFLMVFCIFFLNSCTQSFDEEVANHIESKCSDFSTPKSCLVDIIEVTEFDWDSMFVFASMTMPYEINSIIGFDCNCNHVKDNYTRVVFTKDQKIVYQNQYYGLSSMVQFRSINKTDKYIKYSRKESIFYALKRNNTLSDGYFYDLYPLNGEKSLH